MKCKSDCCLSKAVTDFTFVQLLSVSAVIGHQPCVSICRSMVKRWISALSWVAVTAVVLGLILGICYGKSCPSQTSLALHIILVTCLCVMYT